MLKWARELGCPWDENATLPRLFLKLPKWKHDVLIWAYPHFPGSEFREIVEDEGTPEVQAGVLTTTRCRSRSTHKSPNVGSLQDNPRDKNKNSDNPHPFNSFKNKFYKTNSAW
jgi:hypothetical protein